MHNGQHLLVQTFQFLSNRPQMIRDIRLDIRSNRYGKQETCDSQAANSTKKRFSKKNPEEFKVTLHTTAAKKYFPVVLGQLNRQLNTVFISERVLGT